LDFSATHSMYFIAVLCPPELDKKVLKYKLWMKKNFGCTVAMKSPAHITLVPPFWLENKEEPVLMKALLSFSTDIGELTILLNGFGHFDKRVLFISAAPNPGLEEIKLQAENYFNSSVSDKIRKDNRPFRPHITIAARDMKPSVFQKAWDNFSSQTLNETFISKTISLLKLCPGKWNIIGEKKLADKNRG